MKYFRWPGILFLAVFLLLPVYYAIFIAPYGYSDTDEGFIQGLSWRILNGEVPYRDFEYVRPPLPLYLHALEMKVLPDSSEILLSRFVCIFTVWVTVLFSLLSLRRWIDPAKNPFWLIACCGFILSMHNMVLMPWHTTDGLLFASIGIFLFTCGPGEIWLTSGMLSLFLAAMCKQPFYLLPFAGIGFAAFLHGKSKALETAAILAGILFVFICGWIVVDKESFSAMLSQTSGATSFSDFLSQGILEYAKPGTAAALVLILFIWKNPFAEKGGLYKAMPVLLWFAFTLSLLALNVYFTFKEQTWRAPSFGWPHGLWMFSVFFALTLPGLQRNFRITLLMLLGTTWLAGVSWGYPIPIHFAIPMAVCLWVVLQNNLTHRSAVSVYLFFALSAFVSFRMLAEYTYRDQARVSLHEVYTNTPRETYNLQFGKPMKSEILSMMALAQKHKVPFTVMPAMPAANYLTRTRNPLPWEWEHNAEMNLRDTTEVLQKWILPSNQPPIAVFLQKDHLKELDDQGKYGSWVADAVRRHWIKTDENEDFIVYIRGNTKE